MRAAAASPALETDPIGYDPLSPAVIADPYPWYRRLLADAAPRVYHDRRNDVWVLSRYDDVHEAVRNPGALSSAEGVAFRRMYSPMMITSDPPDHTRLRRIVSREFTPRMLERWQPMIDRLAVEAVGRLGHDRPVDFVAEVASPFPVTVIAAILGIGDEDLPQLRRISGDVIEMFKMTDPDNRAARVIVDVMSRPRMVTSLTRAGMRFPGATRTFMRGLTALTRRLVGEQQWADDVARGPRGVADLQGVCAALVRQRRRNPGDDLISKLLAEHPDGHLNDSEIFFFFLLLLIAGHETTTNLLGNMVIALAGRPEEWRKLKADPNLVPTAVRESLRYESPIQGFFRTAVTSYRVGDVEIPKGARVLLLFGAGNWDPRHYPDPDQFRVDRDPRDHLGFGGGIHYCLGASLAEMEGTAVLRELLTAADRIEVVGGIVRTQNPTLRGAKRLPVRLRA
jgi:cytochrome P450